MLPILLYTFGAVFMAEIVGDKLLYTTGLLATRYRTLPIMCGMAAAFTLKMAAAVMVGHFIATLPLWLVATVTALNFFGIAFVLWRKPDQREVKPTDYPAHRAALVAFAAIFFSEWGDVGQLTAATMAAKFAGPGAVAGAAFAVWLGAVTAMVTKGTLASFIGSGVRVWIQAHFAPRTIRYAAVAILGVLGVLSVVESFLGHEAEAPALFLRLVN